MMKTDPLTCRIIMRKGWTVLVTGQFLYVTPKDDHHSILLRII